MRTRKTLPTDRNLSHLVSLTSASAISSSDLFLQQDPDRSPQDRQIPFLQATIPSLPIPGSAPRPISTPKCARSRKWDPQPSPLSRLSRLKIRRRRSPNDVRLATKSLGMRRTGRIPVRESRRGVVIGALGVRGLTGLFGPKRIVDAISFCGSLNPGIYFEA